MMYFNITDVIQLTLPYPSLTAIVGPSGSGKTTFLENIIRNYWDKKTHIKIDGVPWNQNGNALSLEKRRVAYMKQKPYLFPHLTVEKNLQYGFSRSPAKPTQFFLNEIIEQFDMLPLLKKFPRHLSGGQYQRVAMTQAIVSCPTLLLLDEPFSALDEKQKSHIMLQLKSYVTHAKIALLFSTHALHEVASLAEQVISFDEGHLKSVTDCESFLKTQPVYHYESLFSTTINS